MCNNEQRPVHKTRGKSQGTRRLCSRHSSHFCIIFYLLLFQHVNHLNQRVQRVFGGSLELQRINPDQTFDCENSVLSSSSCQPALWQVNNEMTSQLAGGWIQRRNRLRRCRDLPWSLWSLLCDSWPLPPPWSPFSVFVTAPLIMPAGLLHSKSADLTYWVTAWAYSIHIGKFIKKDPAKIMEDILCIWKV